MFNLSGSEIVFILLLALVILGPEKLPEALRSFGRAYGEFKKLSGGFQSELKQALDEPVRELRSTADALRTAASFDVAADLLEGKQASGAAVVAAGGASDPFAANGAPARPDSTSAPEVLSVTDPPVPGEAPVDTTATGPASDTAGADETSGESFSGTDFDHEPGTRPR